MKKNLFLAIVSLTLLGACSDDDTTPVAPEEQNKYITGVDLSKSYTLNKALATFSDEPFHALGYGYDITGKYAHPESIRKKVVDPQKYEDDHYYDVMRNRKIFYHRGLGTIEGTKNTVKEQLLKELEISSDNPSKEYKNAFKELFDTPFENDNTFTDVEYYYAINSFVSSWYGYYFSLYYEESLSLLSDYLTDEFRSDLNIKSAKEIINLYGTHVMVSIEVGCRQDFNYRSSSMYSLDRNMIRASSKYLQSTPGVWQSPTPDPTNEKENIYTEYVNGIDLKGETNAWMIDITNYSEDIKAEYKNYTIDDKSTVLVNWGTSSWSGSSPIIPIYEFVSDTAKKEALKEAYKEYLSK